MPHEKPIGIDLGTTNSAMAWVEDTGRSAMIPNAEGEFITPSVVFFSETEVVVGKNARTAITAHPDLVAQWVKRDMGAAYYSHPIHGHYLPPEVIQACILRKLKADLSHALGGDSQVVITVPAYFDELRRKATADAGEMAGLRVLDIVNEPTAAALAFGEALGYLTPGPPHANQARQQLCVLVYDLGGGTFDATLLRLAEAKVVTLATDGDVQLGGHDWDQRLVDYAADSFVKTHKIDPRQDPAALNRLFLDAMEAKHTLSARQRAVIPINYEGRVAEVIVTRQQFEEMSADLLERTAYTSRQLLTVAGLEWKDVQRVLLVGGSTRMPMVARMLQELTGIQPDRTVNPDEAVARGAALYADHLLAERGGATLAGEPRSTFHVTNVNAHSLGVEGIETETLRKKNIVLIPRNTPLPARHTERFATKQDGQRSILIKVLEGESSQPGDCIAIGRTTVRELPAGLPKGWPVEVTFVYGTNGRLEVNALVPGTQHQARLELVRDARLSPEGLSRWKQPVSAAGGLGAFESAADEVLSTAPSPGPSPSGIGWALVVPTSAGPPQADRLKAGLPAAAPAATGDGKTMVGPAPPPVPAPVAPAAPAQKWFSGPRPLTNFNSQSPEKGEGVAILGSPLGEAAEQDVMAEAAADPAVPLIERPQPAKKRRRIPKWLERVIGHGIVLLIFAAVAYLMISHARPDFFPRLFGGQQHTSKPAEPAP